MQNPEDQHSFGTRSSRSKGKGHPIMYGLGCDDPAKVLHLCSGSVVTGTRVDIRPKKNPDIVADCRNVPLPDESFDFVLAGPAVCR